MASRSFVWLGPLLLSVAAHAQIIDFESGGLKFKTMTRGGVTIMFAHLPIHLKDYAVLQVAISNGSPISWTVKPQDFRFEKADGEGMQALAAGTVVQHLIEKAGRGDVIKLISAYEASLNGNTQLHSTNGYESRRQNAQAELGSGKLKAAAAASAIALVQTRLAAGQTTDGAIFYQSKELGAGKLIANIAGEVFVFPMDAEPHPAH